ncbi:uncharacterized protein [Littorina saxatilis]|uniref:C2H2-type domain-containing protein n=1 Tax=Littorina saxatilis TaxID=31220 RepID=A0AAN9C287_9CAEN
MASRVMDASPSIHQGGTPIDTQNGMTVLNDVSSLTVQRTIVEAFVKLVVCRKVTVQKVAPVTGQVIDSHTTQEEDSPVILNVHRHELSDICSALASNLKLTSTSSCVHSNSSTTVQPPPPPSTTTTKKHVAERSDHTSASSKDKPTESLKSAKSNKADAVQRSEPYARVAAPDHGNDRCTSADSGLQNRLYADCFQGTSRPSSAGSLLQPVNIDKSLHGNSACQKRVESDQCKDTQEEIHCTNQQEHEDIGTHDQGSSSCKKRRTDGNNTSLTPDATTQRKESAPVHFEDRIVPCNSDSDSKTADSADKHESHNTDRQVLKALYEEQSVSKAGKTLVASATSDVKQRSRERLEAYLNNPMCIADEQTTQADDFTENATGEDILQSSVEVSAAGMEGDMLPESPHAETPAQAMAVDYGHSATEEATPFETDSIDNFDTQDSAEMSLSEKQLSVSDFDTAGSENGDENVTVFMDGEGNLSAPQSVDNREGREEGTADSPGDGDCSVSNNQERYKDPENTSEQLGEDASEDGSDTIKMTPDAPEVLEAEQSKPSQGIGECEDTDQDLLVIDISEQDSNPASSGAEQESQPVEKLDPFAHLFEASFPPLDRTHDNVPHPSAKDSHSGKNKTSREVPKSAVKEEPDDDCMIMAAFISPQSTRKRSASHTATSRSAADSVLPGNTSMGGGHYSRTTQGRGRLTQGGWVQQSAVRFHHSAQRPAVYQGAAQHSDGPPPQAHSLTTHTEYLPNFLASTSQSADLAVPQTAQPQPEEGSSAIDYSQQTYECAICSKIFLHRRKFDMHVMICGGHRPFKCKICYKGFNQRAHLDTHMKFHIGIKRYRCDLCRKAYVMKGDLIRHLKTRVHRQAQALQNPGLPLQTQSFPSQ